jgi:hypothetical protein
VSFALDVNILLYASDASSALHAGTLAFVKVVDSLSDREKLNTRHSSDSSFDNHPRRSGYALPTGSRMAESHGGQVALPRPGAPKTARRWE